MQSSQPRGNNVKSSVKKTKKQVGENQQQDLYVLNETLKLIDSMFEMRFIQKISRPIQKRAKEEYVQKFAGKMENLHQKLQRIKVEINEKTQSQNANVKGRSVIGSVTHKPVDWKKTIRSIQNRYIEVFIQGSFKHYGKLYQLNSFPFPLKTINIEAWALQCLNQQTKSSSCCCC